MTHFLRITSLLVALFSFAGIAAEEPSIPAYDPFAQIEPEIGEKLWPNEREHSKEIVANTSHFIQQKYDEGRRPAMRDAHAKAHACTESTFQIRKDIPAGLRHGVFATPGKLYKSVIRFSNGNPEVRMDSKRDGRGFAIKLLDVDGKKLIPEFPETTTQDFLLLNFPAFFIDDPSHYIAAIRYFHNPDLSSGKAALLALTKALKGPERGVAIKHQTRVHNPFNEVYWSELPYRLGLTAEGKTIQAVKFAVFPVSCGSMDIPRDLASQQKFVKKVRDKNHKNIPKDKLENYNYLKEEMSRTMEETSVCYVFGFQHFVDLESTPIERTTVVWDESSAFIPAADIVVPKGQDILSEDAQRKCENLSFTPWHALPEHKVLGAIGRARLQVYSAIAKLRRDLNQVPPSERQNPMGR